MTDGVLTEETEAESMQNDVAMILIQITRDRPDCGLRVEAAKLGDVATLVARELAIRIGGRYLPKRDEKAKRNKAAMEMFNGNNRPEVMKAFNMSKRVFYRVLSDHLRSRARGR